MKQRRETERNGQEAQDAFIPHSFQNRRGIGQQPLLEGFVLPRLLEPKDWRLLKRTKVIWKCENAVLRKDSSSRLLQNFLHEAAESDLNRRSLRRAGQEPLAERTVGQFETLGKNNVRARGSLTHDLFQSSVKLKLTHYRTDGPIAEVGTFLITYLLHELLVKLLPG
jgi:hypothetical protein